MQTKKTMTEIIIFLLILMWVYTFVSKIFDFDTFKRQINGAYLLSRVGFVLPYLLQALHMIIFVMLISKFWRKTGIIASLSLLILYSTYLIYILKFAPSIPCSCIAVMRGMNWNDQLYFNFIAIIINTIGLITFLSLKRAPHNNVQTNYN
jgi:hypothetical protein